MATLRTMHKRKRRKLMIAAQPCQHREWMKVYYGDQCVRCGLFYPDGCAPWDIDWDDDYPDADFDDDDDRYCYTCGGEGRIIDCWDDLCQDGCIHGDGERACPDCDNWM